MLSCLTEFFGHDKNLSGQVQCLSVKKHRTGVSETIFLFGIENWRWTCFFVSVFSPLLFTTVNLKEDHQDLFERIANGDG